MFVVGLAIYWFQVFYMEPNRTFWGAVDNALTTNGVVKLTTQDQAGVTIDTFNRLSFNPTLKAHSLKKITDNTATPASKLTVETIGTKSNDYQRYSQIERTLQNGKKIDYSAVYPLWINATSSSHQPQQLKNSLFGYLLFGNLPLPQREPILASLSKAYQPHFVKRTAENGRRAYTYNVKLNMEAFAEAAQKYGLLLGLPGAGQIKPSAYDKSTAVELQIVIDAPSRQLISIKNSSSGSSEEKYSGYGIVDTVKPPQKTASLQDLQNAIQSATP